MNCKKLLTVFLSLTATFSTSLCEEETKLTEEQYLEGAGWNIGSQSIESLNHQFNLTDKERQAVINGLINGAQGKSAPFDLEKQNENMLASLQARAAKQMELQEKEMKKEAETNKAKTVAFFKTLDDKKIKKTASGLYYEILKEGSKDFPSDSSSVTVHYVGKLINGQEFDSSIKRGKPATFSLEAVIPGFKEGLTLIGKGGKIRLYIPSELGYGDRQLPGIPAGSCLIFEVEMIDFTNETNKK